MLFKTPQFIDIEDKIFGPFSFKQFIYLAGGLGLAYISTKIVPFFIFKAIFFAFFVGLGVALAFLKPNGKPFIFYLQSMLKYYFSPKTYIWKKGDDTMQTSANSSTQIISSGAFKKESSPSGEIRPITESDIHELADLLNKK